MRVHREQEIANGFWRAAERERETTNFCSLKHFHFHLFRKFLLVGSCEGNQKKLTWWHIYSNIFVSFIEEKGLSARYKNASLSSHSFYCWLLPSVLPSFSFTLLALLLVAVFLGVLCDKSIPKWICCQNTFWFMPNRLRISLSSSSILLSFRLVLRFISS